jgi:mRNA-degrading endonuclease toxin of MazEF toxin-antitoxin module
MQILKKFQEWFVIKEKIDLTTKIPRFEEGQIWWCYLGENVGHEENGKGDQFLRPVLILKKFNKRLFYGIPTTSIVKENKYYYTINVKDKDISLLMSQMRVIDGNRLLYKNSRLSDSDFILIKKYFAKLILGKI